MDEPLAFDVLPELADANLPGRRCAWEKPALLATATGRWLARGWWLLGWLLWLLWGLPIQIHPAVSRHGLAEIPRDAADRQEISDKKS